MRLFRGVPWRYALALRATCFGLILLGLFTPINGVALTALFFATLAIYWGGALYLRRRFAKPLKGG